MNNAKQIAFNISQALTRISDAEMRIEIIGKWSSDSVLFFDEYEKRQRIDKVTAIKERWKNYLRNQCINLMIQI